MKNNLERIWKEMVLAYSRCYPDTCQDRTHEKKRNNDNRSSCRDSTPDVEHYRYTDILSATSFRRCIQLHAVYLYKEYVSLRYVEQQTVT
jgi:hypothetical protein